jgi:glucose/arabinose dehydrogenase
VSVPARRRNATRAKLARAALAVLLVLVCAAVTGCATFPETGAREWREKLDPGANPPPAPPPGAPGGGEQGEPGQPPGPPQPPTGCTDPDPQVIETCLDPVAAVAPLPDGRTALVAERATGRVLRVARDQDPQVVATVPVDATAGGGLTGLVLSPGYRSDNLIYAYITTPTDNRVVRIAPNEPPEPVLSGIPRGPANNDGALGVDRDGNLLVATGDAGSAPAPTSLAGKLLRIDTLGRPAPGNPDPASPVHSSGLHAPGGVCTERASGTVWLTDRLADRDVLYRVAAGPLGTPAWSWPDRPGAAGCVAGAGLVAVAQSGAAALYVLRPAPGGAFTGQPETMLAGMYGRLSPAGLGPDGLLWLGTVNKGGGGTVVSSDDRVIRIQPPSGGGSKA